MFTIFFVLALVAILLLTELLFVSGDGSTLRTLATLSASPGVRQAAFLYIQYIHVL